MKNRSFLAVILLIILAGFSLLLINLQNSHSADKSIPPIGFNQLNDYPGPTLSSSESDPPPKASEAPPKTFDEAVAQARLVIGREPGEPLLTQLRIQYATIEEAITIFDNMERGFKRKIAGSEVAKRLAKEDPDLGVQWLSSLELDPTNEPFVSSFASELANSDSYKAQALLQSIHEDRFKCVYVEAILKQFANENAQSALSFWTNNSSWLEQTGLSSDQAIFTILRSSSLAGNVSENFLIENLDKIQTNTLKIEATKSVVQALVNRDVESAKNWVGALEDTQQRHTSIAQLVSSWFEKDSLATSDWVRQQKNDQDRDIGILALMDKAQKYAPAEALEWVQAITDPKLRVSEATVRYLKLANSNPNLAKEIITQSRMSDAEKSRILSFSK